MKKTLAVVSEYAQILVGILLASLGLKAFLLPNGFLDGGVTGIAILLSEVYDWNISTLLLLISLPFLLLAAVTVSRKIVIKSVISIVALSIFIHFENFTPLTDDKLLIAIFGGLFLGAGIGITIRNGAVLDGSEVLGLFMNDRFGLSIGSVILVFNVILFIIAGVVLSSEVAMYSILTYLVTARVIDFFIKGFENYVGLMIVSHNNLELERQLLQHIGTGLTVYSCPRGYGSRGKRESGEIIHVIINRIDIRKTYNLVHEVDSEAFIIEFDVNNVSGGVLRKYLSRNDKKLSPSIINEGIVAPVNLN